MKRRLISALLTLCIVLQAATPSFAAAAVGYSQGSVPSPTIEGTAGILMDATTGTVLWEKNANALNYPASTTKIMTGILALENLDLSQNLIIDEEVVQTTGSRWRLALSDSISLNDALYSLFLVSYNDVAVGLAKNVAGDVASFAAMMNEKAKAIGCKNTNFTNPNGLPDENHVTTAYDLAMMMKYALTVPGFVEYASTKTYTLPATVLNPENEVTNTNSLLTGTDSPCFVNGKKRMMVYEGTVCGKTGYTSAAGGVLVTVAEQDGTTLIAVTMHSGAVERFTDCIAMLDWGFDKYHTLHVMNKDAVLGSVDVKRGSVLSVDIIAPEDKYATLKRSVTLEDITYTFESFGTLQAPVRAGDTAGTYKIYENGNLLSEYGAVTSRDVPKGGFLSIFGIPDLTAARIYKTAGLVFSGLALVCLVLALVGLIGHGSGRRIYSRRRRRF